MSESPDRSDRIDVGGHEVYPEQKAELPCPVCSQDQEVYYLGSRSSMTAGNQPRSYAVSGWVCPECESTLEVTDEDMTDDPSMADVIVRTRQEETEGSA